MGGAGVDRRQNRLHSPDAEREGVSIEVAEKMKALELKYRELRQASEILRLFRPGGARSPFKK